MNRKQLPRLSATATAALPSLLASGAAHASIYKGETLDAVASGSRGSC